MLLTRSGGRYCNAADCGTPLPGAGSGEEEMSEVMSEGGKESFVGLEAAAWSPDRAAKSLRFVQPVFTIHPNPEVNEGIFARLDDAIRAALFGLSREAPTEDNMLLQSFFNWALWNLDADAYAAIQNKCIDMWRNGSLDTYKFLNLPFYVKRKMRQLRRLGLHQGPPKRILDIGCGPGHFQLMAKYFGHEGVGMDLPFQADHFFNALCGFFGVPKMDYRIEPMQPLPTLPERFDLVTIFLTQFDFNKDYTPWNVQYWRFFVDDVCNNILKPDGVLYFTLTSEPRPTEVLQYLKSVQAKPDKSPS